MNQNNNIIIAITIFFAGVLGEAYILADKMGIVPFAVVGALMLADVVFLSLQVSALLHFQNKRQTSVTKEESDNLYRLVESRLYNIERYQKAIYNETESTRISAEELSLGAEAPSGKNGSGSDIDKLIVRQKAIMERMAKAIIVSNRDNNKELLSQLQNNNAQTGSGSHENLEQILSSLEITQKKLLKALENIHVSPVSEAAESLSAEMLSETAAMEMEQDTAFEVQEEDNNALNAILAESSLETESPAEKSPSDGDGQTDSATLPAEEELDMDRFINMLEESIPDMDITDALPDIITEPASNEPSTMTMDTAAEEPDMDILETEAEVPDIDILKTETEIPDIDIPDAETEIPDIDIPETEAEVPDIDIPETETEVPVTAEMDNEAEIAASKTVPEENVTEEAVPEAAATEEAGEDLNRQLTPEEIAAMFASM